jgi:16S rRNA (guanine527-N7)-methyltransferase
VAKDDISGLSRILKSYGITLTQSQLSLFDTYLDELERWNKGINLTGLTSRKRMMNELLMDSLIPAPYVPAHGFGLDIGSGAGFPAIPIKILHPDLFFQLIEATRKKVIFLKHAIRVLKLDGIHVIHGRIENLRQELHDPGYHIVTARAVAGFSQIMKLCAPHIRFGGILVGFFGPGRAWETEKNTLALARYGLDLDRVIPYRLPGQRHQRNAAILRKKIRPL